MSVLRNMFGPSREAVWRALTERVGGEFVEGGFWHGDKVQINHGEWTVTLDRHVVSTGKTTHVFTRMRAPFVNADNFRFTVSRRGLFSSVGAWFGAQDVQVGQEPFDRDFIIKASDEDRVKRLFANARIRQLIDQQPSIRFGVKDDEGWFGPTFPEGVDELHFEVHGTIKDVDRLRQIYDLFAETLDELTRMGAAYGHAPDLKL